MGIEQITENLEGENKNNKLASGDLWVYFSWLSSFSVSILFVFSN